MILVLLTFGLLFKLQNFKKVKLIFGWFAENNKTDHFISDNL